MERGGEKNFAEWYFCTLHLAFVLKKTKLLSLERSISTRTILLRKETLVYIQVNVVSLDGHIGTPK